MNLKQAAWFSAVPWGTMAISGYIAGLVSDFLVKAGCSVTLVRKIMQVKLLNYYLGKKTQIPNYGARYGTKQWHGFVVGLLISPVCEANNATVTCHLVTNVAQNETRIWVPQGVSPPCRCPS